MHDACVASVTDYDAIAAGVHYHPPSAEHALLQDISLQLPPASLAVIYGRSGAGKSTLLQVIAGLRDPTGGDISLIQGAPA